MMDLSFPSPAPSKRANEKRKSVHNAAGKNKTELSISTTSQPMVSSSNGILDMIRRSTRIAPTMEDASSISDDSTIQEHTPRENAAMVVGCQDRLELLVEIVGCTGLESDDPASLRPYCHVNFKNRVHKTLPVSGQNPIWTLDSHSLFLLKATPSELLQHALTVQVYSKLGKLQSRTFLGSASLEGQSLIKSAKEDRFEIRLEDQCHEILDAKLALRIRLATPQDIKFVQTFYNNPTEAARLLGENLKIHKLVTEADETGVAGASFYNALTSAFSSSRITDQGTSKIRVKPHPDRKCPKQTTYLSREQLKFQSLQPSHEWIEAGSGKLGKLYLEVLSCHDLPNVDVGEAVGNVTDSFVCAVFEDAVVQTPVIDDELSPHWMPWTQRAFSFGILHPASILYLGVFDFDLGPLNSHEPVGRIAIPICQFQNNTEYKLRYNLYKSANVNDRTAQGTITIRLRLVIPDEKKALLEALKPRPVIHVNTAKPKTFKCVRYACFGEHDEEKFDLTVIRSYISEIFEYKRHLSYYIGDSVRSLMFWRGQVEVYGLLLPLHSFLFFFFASTLVERPYLFPSFLILSVSWVMLANSSERIQHPSPWHRCKPFWHYIRILWTGRSTPLYNKIEAKQGWEQTIEHDKALSRRFEQDLKTAEKKAEMEQELNVIGNEAIHTEVPNLPIPIDLLERLGRWQGYVGAVCRFFRWIKVIATWDDSVVSFWFSAVFFAVGIVSLILPWAFILTWTGRILVWGLFGPHMKFVDLILQAHKKDNLKDLVRKFKEKYQAARIRREDALKLKSIKCFRFGQYITHVPAFNLARHQDRPLPLSVAKLCRKAPAIRLSREVIPGQQLYGTMIPRPYLVEERNKEDRIRQERKLDLVEARLVAVKTATSLGGGIDGNMLITPRANGNQCLSGYELVQWGGKSLTDMMGDRNMDWIAPQLDGACYSPLEGMNLCVVSRGVKKERDDPPQTVFMVLTDEHQLRSGSDVLSEYCKQRQEILRDEGVEVVAWGRFSSGTELDEEKEVEREVHPMDSMDEDGIEMVCPSFQEKKQRVVPNLSVLYRASDSTFVAFYRPS